MAVRLLERVPTEEIRREAREVAPIHVGQWLVILLIGIVYAVGWTAGKASIGGRIVRVAARRGWQDARGDLGGRPRGGG